MLATLSIYCWLIYCWSHSEFLASAIGVTPQAWQHESIGGVCAGALAGMTCHAEPFPQLFCDFHPGCLNVG